MRFTTLSLAALSLFLAACGGAGTPGAVEGTGIETPVEEAPLAPPHIETVTAQTLRDGIAAGPTSGGTRITITGSGFRSGLVVEVDDKQGLDVHVESSTRVRATTPAGAAGIQPVRVRLGTDVSEDSSGFEYRANKTYWATNAPNGSGTQTWVHSLDPETGEHHSDELTFFTVEAMATANDGRLFGVGVSRAGGTDYGKRFVFEIRFGSDPSVTSAHWVELRDQTRRVLGMDFYRDSLHVLIDNGEMLHVGTLDVETGEIRSHEQHEFDNVTPGEGLAVDAGGEQVQAPYGRLLVAGIPAPHLYAGHDKEAIVRDVRLTGLGLGEYVSAMAFSGGELLALIADYGGGAVLLVRIDRETGAFDELANLGARVDALATDFR